MKWFIGPCSIQCYRGSIKDGLCFRFHTFCNVFMQLDSFIGAIELSSDKWAQVPRSRVNSEMSHLSVLWAGWVMKCCAYAGTKLIWPNVKKTWQSRFRFLIHEILENNLSGFIIDFYHSLVGLYKASYTHLFCFSLLLVPLIKCYYRLGFFLKRQSLVAVCSRGSAHFLQHAAQSAESRAVSEDQRLLFCWIGHAASLTHNGIGAVGGVVTLSHGGPPGRLWVTRIHRLSLTHTHWWLCLYLSTDSRLFESFFLSLPLL